MANTANSRLTTNFNVTPYYDDYDESKGYYRILYKPGFAVQGRELTQMQTILQKQVDRFGKHIFREGSIVLPEQFSIRQAIEKVDYVKVSDVDNAGVDVNINNFLNKEIRGLTNNVAAYVVNVADGISTSSNTKTLFVRYLNGSNNNTLIKTFGASEILSTNAGANLVVLPSGSTPIGQGTRLVLPEGVLFAKEHFIRFNQTSTILSRYTTSPTCRVGFNIVEEIINYTQDASLLDPALEASNYSAPGADRLKLTPNLEVRDINDTEGSPNFAQIFTMNEGVLTEVNDRPQYNILRDELAKRTFDESGDYYVNGLSVRVRENLDNNVNGGLSQTGSNTKLSVGVEPGVAYVKGYEVGKLVTDYVTIDKATTYANVSTQFGAATMGSYVLANEVKGKLELDQGQLVFLYDQAQKKVTNKATISTSPALNPIGTARVLSFDYADGLLGTNTGTVAIYLTDIRMNGTNSFAQTRTIHRSGFFADPVLESNNAILKETATASLLYSVGSQSTRTIKDESGQQSLDYIFKKTSTSVSILNGQMNSFGYSSAEEREQLLFSEKADIIVTLNESKNLSTGWTISSGAGTNTLTGAGGSAFLRLNVGDKIQLSGNSDSFYYTITRIPSDTSMELDVALPAVASGNAIFKAYMAGDILDLNAKGLNGQVRTVIPVSTSSVNINFQETGLTGVTAAVTYQVAKGDTVQIQKELVSNAYVVIDMSSSSAPVTGPFNLGIPDVYKVRKIIKKSSSVPSSDTDGEDVTRLFLIDNGQRDTYYEHASITPTGIGITKSDVLLVKLDYFKPSYSLGRGYFSVDSYPTNIIGLENIPIFTSPSTKIQYDLRNFIDFRPIKVQTAAESLTIGGATTNPGLSDNFNYDINGMRFPAPSSTFDFSYSYYLPRRDVVVMDKDGIVSVIKGNPSAVPLTPTVPENVMALASLYIAPFPSLAPNYAQILNRKDLSVIVKKLSNVRYTMRDIGVLKDRIVNLEYYASLTTLEKSAVDMQIVDENNQNRFKNGIFVDTFRDHSLGDINEPNYRVVVDPEEKSIRPIYNMRSNHYKLLSNTALWTSGDLIHLPYDEKVLIEQSAVNIYRNVEYSSYRFLGNLYLTPDIDVWVDTDQLGDNQITTGADTEGLTEGTVTEWNQWQRRIVGYKLYKKSTGQLLASFDANQRDLAYNNAYWLARNLEFNKNTIGLTSSGKRNSGAKFETIVETIYENTRTGSETFTAINEDTQQLGNKVVDISIQSYIRPQTIACNAKGMKPTTRLYVFFDGEDMAKYVTPLTESEYNEKILTGTISSVLTNAEGSDLDSNSDGNAYFLIRLPNTDEKRFRVGQKEVLVIDNPTKSEADATTIAKNYFVAEGLTQQKQNTILTTRTVITVQNDVSESNQTTSEFVQKLRPSCSAYSFIPKAPDGEEGVFLTGVDLFFAAKHPTLGFWIEIREMDSGGGITRNQVPLSEVWIESNDPRYKVDIEDPTVATEIKFPAPIFLYNNVQYALVIHTIGLNPDTYIWVSRVGIEVPDKITKQPITQRPLTGTFFTTNNNLNWIPVDGVDLKVKFYRAAFTTNAEGNAVLGQKPVEKLTITNLTKDFTTYGETIVGNQRLTLSGSITGANVGNDWIVGLTSGANAVISSYASSVASVANISFEKQEYVRKYYGANGVYSGQESQIVDVEMGMGRLDKFKVSQGTYSIDITSSNGKFRTGETVRGLTSDARATIASIDNYRYSVVDFEPSFINFNGTSIAFDMSTISNTSTSHSGFVSIDDNENYYFSDERRILSRSNEDAALSGDSSNKVRVRMSSVSEYTSPILDLSKTHTIYVDNIINSNTYQESYTGASLLLDNAIANTGNLLSVYSSSGYSNTRVISRSGNTVIINVPPSDYYSNDVVSIYNSDNSTIRAIANVVNVFTNYTRNSGGALYNRYISRPVVLAENQDAEDILVILTAYRPAGTEVPVWIRIQNNEDIDAFSSISWIKLEMVDSSAYSSSSDRNDFKEYTYKFPTSYMTAPEPQLGAVQYRNSQGTLFTGFKTFSLKIGLESTNSAVVPRVADLRAIALQI